MTTPLPPDATRECPFCAETIKTRAIKCRHCGSVLTEEALAAFARELDRGRGSKAPPVAADATVAAAPPPFAGATRLATILFADLSGFTALTGSREPEEIREIMNALFSDLAGAVERFGGLVDKYIGDCVMAVWGVDETREEDAVRATNAAFSMLYRVKARAERLGLPLALHAGLSTGRVVFGNLGAGIGATRTVIGDAVNLASRLCDAAPPGAVLVSEETWRRLGGRFGGESLELELKGIGLVRSYRVAAGTGRTRVTQHIATGFLGRVAERDRIAAALDALRSATDSSPRGLLVVGNGGTGKSRLCAHSLRRHGRGLRVLFAQGIPVEVPAFGGFVAAWLRELIGGADPESIDRFLAGQPALAAYQTTLRFCLAPEADPGRAVRASDNPLEQTLAAFFHEVSRTIPLVFAGADVQWIDPLSLDFCVRLLEPGGPGRCLLLLDGRPGGTSDRLRSVPGFEALELGPFTPEQTGEFLTVFLAEPPSPPWVRAVHDRTGGIVLHLVQVIDGLAEARVLECQPETGRWRLVRAEAELPLPPSLADLIWLRIERLPTWPREVLLHAGVCGLRFPIELLRAATGRTDAELAPALETLRADGFLIASGELIVFEHGAFRETARRILLKGERRRIADRILDVFGERIWANWFRPLAPDLFREAGRETPLRRFLITDAYRLLRAFRPDEARAVLNSVGREPWPTDPDGQRGESEYWTALGRLAEVEHNPAASFEHHRRAVELLRRAGGPTPELARALGLLGRIAAKREEWSTAVETTREALAISRMLGDERGIGIHTFMLGWIEELRGAWDRALPYYEASLPMREGERGRRIVHGSIARAALGIGDLAKAREYIRLALASAVLDGCLQWNPHAYVIIVTTAGQVAWRTGAERHAMDCLESALAAARSTGDDETLLVILCPLAQLANETGNSGPAAALADQARAAARRLAQPRGDRTVTELTTGRPVARPTAAPELNDRFRRLAESLAGPPPDRDSLQPVRLDEEPGS